MSFYNNRHEKHHVVGSKKSGSVSKDLFAWIHAAGVDELADVGLGRFIGHRYVETVETLSGGSAAVGVGNAIPRAGAGLPYPG